MPDPFTPKTVTIVVVGTIAALIAAQTWYLREKIRDVAKPSFYNPGFWVVPPVDTQTFKFWGYAWPADTSIEILVFNEPYRDAAGEVAAEASWKKVATGTTSATGCFGERDVGCYGGLAAVEYLSKKLCGSPPSGWLVNEALFMARGDNYIRIHPVPVYHWFTLQPCN